MEMIEVSLALLSLLFIVGVAAGMVDAIAGGGGLIALPVLLATGISPTQALATNKLQGCFGTFSASLYFIRHGLVELRKIRFMIICTFVGSALGTLMVQNIDTGYLSRAIPLLLILIALYFWFSPTISEESTRARISQHGFALTIGFSVGFYDGFFGPGTGSFFAIGFVGLLGFGLSRATAHTKVLNLTSNLASLLFFIAYGQVIWSLGISMGLGQLLGARLGANMVLRKGARLIRPVIVVVSVLISLKLMHAGYLSGAGPG